MEREIRIGDRFKHFKGDYMIVTDIATHSETEEIFVIYKHEGQNKTWARPIAMFNSIVDKEKYPNIKQKYRFEKVDQ